MKSKSIFSCPACGSSDNSVQNTKLTKDGARLRRRVCSGCNHNWYTLQAAEMQLDKSQVYWGRRFAHVLGMRT